MASSDAKVRLDLNNPVFQANLLTLQKPERHAALDTLNKIRQLTWNQLYRDQGLKWEKITSVKPPEGIDAIYSLRITQARRPPRIAMRISFACSPSRPITMRPMGRSESMGSAPNFSAGKNAQKP